MSLKEKPLSSWKEIAAYLGCDERTCLRWEKRFALPVHRLQDDKGKSHVFAYEAELDQWLRGRKHPPGGDLPSGQEASRSPRPARRTLGLWPILALVVGLTLIIYLILSARARVDKAQPADFRIEGSKLIIVDDRANEIWRYETGLRDLISEAEYRLHFQTRSIGPQGSRSAPYLLIRDINNDRRKEVLFSTQTQANFSRGKVLCFDHRGRVLWSHDVGREMVFGRTSYPPIYGVQAMDVFPRDDGRGDWVLVIAYQHPEFPTYALMLTTEGKPFGEYWNSGRLSDYVCLDIDGDARRELVLAGTNNEYLKACLAVIEPESARGGSPQTGDYRSDELAPGSEEYYLLFPRTPVDKLADVREAFDLLDVFGGNRLIVRALSSSLFYRLDFRLVLETLIFSDTFWRKYRRFQEEGRLPAGKIDAERLRRELSSGILYWDGEGWVSSPTRNKRNEPLSDSR